MNGKHASEGVPSTSQAPTPDNPWTVLGLSENAGDRQVREAYLRRVREHPPDRDPETFERIRDAYEAIRDPYRRFTRLIASVDPGAPLATLLDEECVGTRRFVGPGPWLAALKEG